MLRGHKRPHSAIVRLRHRKGSAFGITSLRQVNCYSPLITKSQLAEHLNEWSTHSANILMIFWDDNNSLRIFTGYVILYQIDLAFEPNSVAYQNNAVHNIESSISDVRDWMLINKLMINDGKTVFMVIGNNPPLKKHRFDSITVGNDTIPTLFK